MSKRPSPNPDSSHQAPKKPKTNPVFRYTAPTGRVRVTPTVNEHNSTTSESSGSISRSTVVTLSKSEDGRRRGSEKYRNWQQRPSTPPKNQPPDPLIGAHDPTDEDISATFTPEQDNFQNTTETLKSKRQRNNNTSVSHYIFLLSGVISNLYCSLESSTGMALTSRNVSRWTPSTQRSRRFPQPVFLFCLQKAGWHYLQVRRLHGWSPAEVSKLYSFRALFPAISPSQGEGFYIYHSNKFWRFISAGMDSFSTRLHFKV